MNYPVLTLTKLTLLTKPDITVHNLD